MATRVPAVQSVRRPLPHLVAYGSTNKYRPVNRSKASGSSARRPTQTVYRPFPTATMLTMTASVKAMDKPAVGLPNPFVPVQWDLLLRAT